MYRVYYWGDDGSVLEGSVQVDLFSMHVFVVGVERWQEGEGVGMRERRGKRKPKERRGKKG